MTAKVAVSVIIPLHNRGPYVKRAIDSVLQQTFQDFEIIIVDGHSFDNGPDIVKGYNDPRIIFIEQKGKGVSTARNQGVELAKGDLIAFLDADDEWNSRHLEVLVKLREKFPESGIYGTSYQIIQYGNIVKNPDIRTIPIAPWEGLIPNYIQALIYGTNVPICTSSIAIPKYIFLKMGGYLESAPRDEDFELWLRIVMKYSITYSWDGITLWHHDASNRLTDSLYEYSLSGSNKNWSLIRAITVLKNNEVPSKYLPYFNEFIAKLEIRHAEANLQAGHPKEGRKMLKGIETTLFYKQKTFLLILSYLPVWLEKIIYLRVLHSRY